MAGIRVPTYERQTQFVSPYNAPTATAQQMGAGIGKAVEQVGAGITDIGTAFMQQQAKRQQMEDLNYKQARHLGDNEKMYGDFLANRNAATSGAESFAETSKERWRLLREQNDKELRTTGGYRPSRAAIEEANRTGDGMGSQYYRNAMDFEAAARDKKAVDDASANIQKMQAAAAEYGNLETTSIEMEKALEVAKLAMPLETYIALEKTAKAGMGAAVGAYLTRLQDRAVAASSDQERQSFETEAFGHIEAGIARGYIDAADGVEAKRLWKEGYQKRGFPMLDPTERERIARGALDQTNIKDQLFNKESGGNYANDTNQFGFMGGFQFGAPLLSDLKLYTPGATENLKGWEDTGKNAPGKWSGTFNIPGFPDVRTVQDFLHNPEAQDKAWEIHDAKMNDDIARLGLDAFVGSTIDGIPVTIDGIKAAIHLGGATGAEKFFKTATPVGGAVVQAARPVPGKVIQAQAGTRNKPLNANTRSVLDNASGQTGLTVRVKSGAQPSSGPNRTGSTRHDEDVGAADFELIDPRQNNKVLSMEVPEDRARILEFLRITKQGGFTGFGAGIDYMGPTTIHAGFGAPSTWGAGGKGHNAPQWLVEGLMGTPQGSTLQSSTDPADNNGTTMSQYLRMGSNSPSYFDSMPQDQMLIALHQSQIELANQAAANAAQWSAMQAARKGELSLAIETGTLTSAQTILDDDILEAGDKATLYKSYQGAMEEGAVLRENVAAYNRGEYSVNTFDTKNTGQADDVYDYVTKGQDTAAQKATAGKFASDTGYVPKRVMAEMLNGIASAQATTVETAMTDAERMLQIAPRAFASSDNGKKIRNDVAAWKTLQDERGMTPKDAAQHVIKMRDVELTVDDRTREAAQQHVKDLVKDSMETVLGEVGVYEGPNPTIAADQRDALTDDAADIYYEKLLTTAKMDPDIARGQMVAELKTMWGNTSLTGEARTMRHPPQQMYDPVGGTHDYIERSFNHFRAFENIPENATEVQLISTPITTQDARNGGSPRYMVGWFEDRDGQRVWNTSPNFFFVGPQEQANAAAVEQGLARARHRAVQEPQEEIADIMKLPPDERAAELNRRRFGGTRQDYIDEMRRIEHLNRPGRSLEERDAAAAARSPAGISPITVSPEARQVEQQPEFGGDVLGAEGVAAPAGASEAEAKAKIPDIDLRPGQVSVAAQEALIAGLGKKAAQRLLGDKKTWEEAVEGVIEFSEIGGSSERAAERNEAHDKQLQAIGINPRSERKPTMEKLARGMADLRNRMRKAGVPQETQDALIAKLGQTAREMMQGKGGRQYQRIGPGETAETPLAEALGSKPSSDVAAHMRGPEGEQTAFQRIGGSIRSFVPVNARTFVETLFGSRADITEEDFNDEDKSAMLTAVETAYNESGEKEGIIGYGMYGGKGQTADFSRFEGAYAGGAPLEVIVMDSYTDPRFRLETTLGMARYKINDNGSVTITDTYNFNATREQAKKYVAEAGGMPQALVKAFREHGVVGLLNAIGNLAADTEDEAGRKVRIKLGKL